MNATPPDRDLLAAYQNAKYRCEDWHALALWLLDFLQRLRAARDRFDSDCGLVEINGRFEFDPFWLAELQTEWEQLSLLLRLAKERRHDRR